MIISTMEMFLEKIHIRSTVGSPCRCFLIFTYYVMIYYAYLYNKISIIPILYNRGAIHDIGFNDDCYFVYSANTR